MTGGESGRYKEGQKGVREGRGSTTFSAMGCQMPLSAMTTGSAMDASDTSAPCEKEENSDHKNSIELW